MDTDSNGWKSDESAAFLFLRSALLAYFETYKATYEEISSPIKFNDKILQSKFESCLYKSLYFTIITHFQNFFELVLKEALARIHPLLVLKWNKDFTAHLYKELSHSENNFAPTNGQSIEFSETLERLSKIKKIDANNTIITTLKPLLEKDRNLQFLNSLRNQIWHKGVFYLFYSELDLFICQKILPLVKDTVNLDWYSKNALWKYKKLSFCIDPIESLIAEASSKNPSLEKLALYKEMGRAAYHNPQIEIDRCSSLKKIYESDLNRKKSKFAKTKAEALCKNSFISDFSCPICGQKTLLKYEIEDWDTYFDEQGNETRTFYYYTDRIKCEMCSFELRSNIKDLKPCGINEALF